MSEELTLLPCPFCGSRDVEVQGKPAILDALDSVCCNECSADAPYPVWNTRAQIPSQGGEAVAEVVWSPSGTRHGAFKALDGSSLETGTKLYTHPADQVAEPDAELVELLRDAADYLRGLSLPAQLVKRIDAKLAKSEGVKK